MIRFAALCARITPETIAAYEAEAPLADIEAARALLAGQRPKRIATLDQILAWAGEIAGVPDFLLAASLEASGDRAETAALLLPPSLGQAPTLTEALHLLTHATPLTARATLQNLWARLPPQANHVLNRLASGTFRGAAPKVIPDTPPKPQTLRGVMTLVQPAGPEITLALWHEGTLVPIARLPLTITETPEIMAWTRANTLERFGPIRSVPATLVFEVTFDGTHENRRRKSGLDLRNARITAWLRDGEADTLAALTER